MGEGFSLNTSHMTVFLDPLVVLTPDIYFNVFWNSGSGSVPVPSRVWGSWFSLCWRVDRCRPRRSGMPQHAGPRHPQCSPFCRSPHLCALA